MSTAAVHGALGRAERSRARFEHEREDADAERDEAAELIGGAERVERAPRR
jgi:hypothetical protein